MEDRLKINIELHAVGDGRTFLNFWDYKHGDDVVAEIKYGKLFIDVDGVETEITLQKFVDDIKMKFKKL